MLALLAFWEWVKKHWQMVLSGIGIALGFFLGFEVKKKPVIIQGVDPVKTKAEQETAIVDAQATVLEQQQIAQAQATAAQQDAAVVAQEQANTGKIEGDVDQTNQYLQQVGKNIGGGSK